MRMRNGGTAARHLLWSLIVLCCATGAWAQWGTPSVQVVSPVIATIEQSTERQSLAVDVLDFNHAVWGGARTGPAGGIWVLYATTFPMGLWTAPDTLSEANEICYHPCIAVQNGIPHVLFQADGALALMRYTWEGWTRQEAVPDSLYDFSPAIAVDAEGHVHVAWINENGGTETYHIGYAYYDGETWTYDILEGSELGEFGSGAAPQLVATSDGIAHIFYRGGNYPEYRIHHAWNGGAGDTTWAYEPMFTPNAEDLEVAVAASPAHALHVAISGDDGWGFPGRVYHMVKLPRIAWGPPTLVTGTYSAVTPTIAVDGGGLPHIVSMERSGNFYTGNMIYSEYSDTAGWSAGVLAGADYFYPTVVIGPDGYGHLICSTGGNTGEYAIHYLQSEFPLGEGGGSVFVRALPADSSHDPWDGSPPNVRFAWTRWAGSAEVTYILRVYTTTFPNEFDETFYVSDTTHVVEIPIPVLDEDYPFYWTVRATDGIDTVDALNGEGIFFISYEDAVDPIDFQPSSFTLSSYPNPFNPSTTVSFALPKASDVRVGVYDLTGRLVRELAKGRFDAGAHSVAFDGRDLATGVYFAKFEAGNIVRTQKLLLLK